MGNITQTLPIEIFVNPRVVKHIHVRVTCTLEEIQLYIDHFQ